MIARYYNILFEYISRISELEQYCERKFFRSQYRSFHSFLAKYFYDAFLQLFLFYKSVLLHFFNIAVYSPGQLYNYNRKPKCFSLNLKLKIDKIYLIDFFQPFSLSRVCISESCFRGITNEQTGCRKNYN